MAIDTGILSPYMPNYLNGRLDHDGKVRHQSEPMMNRSPGYIRPPFLWLVLAGFFFDVRTVCQLITSKNSTKESSMQPFPQLDI